MELDLSIHRGSGDACCKDRPENHAERKKPETKDHMFSDSMNVWRPEKANLQGQRVDKSLCSALPLFLCVFL